MKTKIIANLVRKSTNEDGELEITFSVNGWNYRNYAQVLEKKEYAIELSEIQNKRTLNQNAMLWKLIHEIAQNENAQSNDDWEVYCYLLGKAKAKYTYISVLEIGLEALKREVRALEVLSYETRENGTKWANCRVFIGSSKMNTKEMANLIDVTIDYAENLGIDTGYYKELML